MTDYDSIWRTQDEIRTVVNAVLGECIWNLSYNERRMAIELDISDTLFIEIMHIFPYFLLFSYIFTNFAVEKRENGLHLGNSNEFDCSRFVPSLHRL